MRKDMEDNNKLFQERFHLSRDEDLLLQIACQAGKSQVII